MKKEDRGRAGRFLVALVIGSILGLFAGSALRARLAARSDPGSVPVDPSDPRTWRTAEIEDSVARKYALAMQERQWDYVIDHTLWMQERLARVAEKGEDPVAARDALAERLAEHVPEGNRLQYAGIEDQYVFSPAATVVPDAADGGRDDLEQPAAYCVWFKVIFPERRWAVLDPANLPIRALRVGVHVTADGYILKANVVGNLDIQWNAIDYDWPETEGG